MNYLGLNYRSFDMRAWQNILIEPTILFDVDDFWNYKSSNYMSSTESQLPLRNSDSGMFSKRNYPKKDPLRCYFQYHTSEFMLKLFQKCLWWSAIFNEFISCFWLPVHISYISSLHSAKTLLLCGIPLESWFYVLKTWTKM